MSRASDIESIAAPLPGDEGFLTRPDGVLVPRVPMEHRAAEYDPIGFAVLQRAQREHFWYRGRHRFLLHALDRIVRSLPPTRQSSLAAIDVGAGCGGWIQYLRERRAGTFRELSMSDSSLDALERARDAVGDDVNRYQTDLLHLPWRERWDVMFMLDVLEHIPDDAAVLQQIHGSLRPGGHLLVTTPAFPGFWSYNDDLVHHVRRYVRADFARLAKETGLELVSTRYFMFFLSPLLLLSRLGGPDLATMTPAEIEAHLVRTHRTPAAPINRALELVFAAETPLGEWLPFPWGTSILGVFRRPE